MSDHCVRRKPNKGNGNGSDGRRRRNVYTHNDFKGVTSARISNADNNENGNYDTKNKLPSAETYNGYEMDTISNTIEWLVRDLTKDKFLNTKMFIVEIKMRSITKYYLNPNFDTNHNGYEGYMRTDDKKLVLNRHVRPKKLSREKGLKGKLPESAAYMDFIDVNVENNNNEYTINIYKDMAICSISDYVEVHSDRWFLRGYNSEKAEVIKYHENCCKDISKSLGMVMSIAEMIVDYLFKHPKDYS